MPQPFAKGFTTGPSFNAPGPMPNFQAGHPMSVGQNNFEKSDEQMKNDLVSKVSLHLLFVTKNSLKQRALVNYNQTVE